MISSQELSFPSPGQYSSDGTKDSGVELSPEPDEDVNSWMSAAEEGSRGEDWSLGKGRISPQRTASLYGEAILLSRSLTTCDLPMFVQPGLVGPTCWNANICASLKDPQISY